MLNDDRRVTIYIWVGCGVTFAVIVLFWVLTLPMQFAKIDTRTNDEPSRWETVTPFPLQP